MTGDDRMDDNRLNDSKTAQDQGSVSIPSMDEIRDERKRILKKAERRKTTLLLILVLIIVAVDIVLAGLLTGFVSWSALQNMLP
jgi:predicted nucleic acid-binding Zn ribbon protein